MSIRGPRDSVLNTLKPLLSRTNSLLKRLFWLRELKFVSCPWALKDTTSRIVKHGIVKAETERADSRRRP